ncbi:uncharacterized protein LOC131220206 [Magnolia sinica]|uniref:uncharacterized protein LOC131220206 n=1 Tax=Magnolia sinica TaxID=86752 RepID=UPI0026593638|nr:uncharacterized protein LOC131220206 [Magnolia sinica]
MDKSWMQKSRVSLEYVKGMKEFIEFAFNNAASEGKILCPCVKCTNLFWRAHKEVVDHLVCEGIMPNYTRWVFHGEASSSSTSGPATSTHDDIPPRDDMHGLLHDVFGISGVDDMPTELPSQEPIQEEPNPVALLLLLALSDGVEGIEGDSDVHCKYGRDLTLLPRPHSVSILEFGAEGDGKTLNTLAFQNAIFYLRSFADKGGAQLYVLAGRWLTGSFNLISHLTLFLEKDAVILGTQDLSLWPVVEPLPSYGRGIELPGERYRSLINGHQLKDVVITGNNGTIDGQGAVWWEWSSSHSLNYSRPHLVELENSTDIVISNLTLLNSPAWNIHPVYCSNVQVQNVMIHAPSDSPYTNSVVPGLMVTHGNDAPIREKIVTWKGTLLNVEGYVALYHICSTRANYTANSTFETNLNQLFSVITSNARFIKYFYDTKGDDGEIVNAWHLPLQRRYH